MINKLVNLKYRDGASIIEHLNIFQSLVNKLTTMQMVLDDDL